MSTRTKVVASPKEALATATCEHDFEYLRPHPFSGGVTAKCRGKCKCTFTAWPGTIHYEEIVAARDAQKKGGERVSTTYQYRDPDKRRAYMRDYMGKWNKLPKCSWCGKKVPKARAHLTTCSPACDAQKKETG